MPISALRRALLALPLLALPYGVQAAENPSVVVSIKPIHGIASAIMAGVGEPVLLLDGASSPHAYSLRPSEARSLQEADLVIYVSHSLEGFLKKPLATLSGDAHQLELADVEGLTILAMREGGAWEAHSHDHGGHDHDDHDHEHEDEHHNEHDHDAHDHDAHDHDHDGHEDHAHADEHDHDHDHEHEHEHEHEGEEGHHHDEHGIDAHLWLDPANGASIAKAIAAELGEIDPDHADTYQDNLKKFLASLDALGNDLNSQLEPVRSKPFVVFHDAYQYLEAGFGLSAVGSITVSPEQKPGAKRLHEIEDKIRNSNAVCVFAEPQFRPAIVEAVVADTGAHIGTLDPLGADIPAGPDAYQNILRQNVGALVDCLSQS